MGDDHVMLAAIINKMSDDQFKYFLQWGEDFKGFWDASDYKDKKTLTDNLGSFD